MMRVVYKRVWPTWCVTTQNVGGGGAINSARERNTGYSEDGRTIRIERSVESVGLAQVAGLLCAYLNVLLLVVYTTYYAVLAACYGPE